MSDVCTIPATLLSCCTSLETITLSVKDPNPSVSGASLTSTVQVKVPYKEQGADVTLSYNFIPDILSIATPSNTQPAFGGKLDITAKVNDRDHDGLFYSWTDNCGGSFSPDTNADPLTFPYQPIKTTWTAPADAGTGAIVQCVLQLEVDDNDNEFTNVGRLIVAVGPPTIL